jgi:hypothetical protein
MKMKRQNDEINGGGLWQKSNTIFFAIRHQPNTLLDFDITAS